MEYKEFTIEWLIASSVIGSDSAPYKSDNRLRGLLK